MNISQIFSSGKMCLNFSEAPESLSMKWVLDKTASTVPSSINILWLHGSVWYSKLFSEKQPSIHSIVLFFFEKSHYLLIVVKWILFPTTDVYVLIFRLEKIFMLFCESLTAKWTLQMDSIQDPDMGRFPWLVLVSTVQSQVSWNTEVGGLKTEGI